MNYKLIYLSTLLLFNGLYAELNFEEGKKILSNIRNSDKLPENEIIGAEISIIENNQLSAIITCDTLISENYESSVLKGNVVAKFYQSEFFEDSNNNGIYDKGEKFDDENGNGSYNHNQCISQMDSDIAYYIEKGNQSSLKAHRNVIVKKFDDIDVIFRDIVDSVKVGDSLDIDHNPRSGQSIILDQNKRIVTGINTIDTVETNLYNGVGINSDGTITRPVTWCKQTSDLVVNGSKVSKNRGEYEPVVRPSAYLIKNVSTSSTEVYVNNLVPSFNPVNEISNATIRNTHQKIVLI